MYDGVLGRFSTLFAWGSPLAGPPARSTDLLSRGQRGIRDMIARDWNVHASGVGYVTRFDVETSYLDQFEVHQVGGRTIFEYWIPAERLDVFNDHIVGQIEEVARFDLVDGEVAEVRLDA